MKKKTPEFGSLEQIDPREIWRDEARDFTPWLSENLSLLSEELGIELELQGTEAGVGGYSLDILAKDLSSNRNVIIENQLTPTNHDHLGKLVTYASGYDAYIAIWIAISFREEHRQALDWMNQRTDLDTQFFGIELKVIRIDDSKPVVQFDLVAIPNEWQKEKERTSAEPSEKQKLYRSYFQKLIDRLREEHHFTTARKGQFQSWYNFGIGVTGIVISANFTSENKVRVELYILHKDKETNKAIFDFLYDDKAAIEKEFRAALSWERLEDKKGSRIAIYKDGTIESNESELDAIMEWQIENILKFKGFFQDRLAEAVEQVK